MEGERMSGKIIHRGETKLIRIKSPNTEHPITELQNVKVRIKQGQNETWLSLTDFTLVTIPETQVQEYQYLISQEMSLSWEVTKKHGYLLSIALVWLNETGTRKEAEVERTFTVLPTIWDEVME